MQKHIVIKAGSFNEFITRVFEREEDIMSDAAPFRVKLRDLLNENSMENGSNTPDNVLASYLENCLNNFDKHVRWREDMLDDTKCDSA